MALGMVLQLYWVGLLIFKAPVLRSVMHWVTALKMTFVDSCSVGVSLARVLRSLFVSKTCPFEVVIPES